MPNQATERSMQIHSSSGMRNQAKIIDKKKQTRQNDLRFLWGWLAAMTGMTSVLTYILSDHGQSTLIWFTECRISDARGDAPVDVPIDDYKSIVIFPSDDYTPALFFYAFILWCLFQTLPYYLLLKYIEIWIPTLFKFIRSTIVPAISVLAALLCGGDPLLFSYFVLSAASGLFFSLAIRIPEDLRFTEPLVSLALGFLAYFRQSLMFNIFIVIFFVDLWFMNMNHVEAKNENVPSRQNMHDRYPINRGPIENGCVQNTQLSTEACAQGKDGSLSPERHGGEVPQVLEHKMILRVREGRGTLYVKTCDTIFVLNDKILSLVRLIISWISEKSLAESLPNNVVHVAEFASQDLDLLVQDDHSVLYLKRCGIRLSIEGENLSSLIQIMKSFCTSQSLPHMLPSTTTLCDIPLLSCLPRAFHGSEVLRLRKWLLGDPQKCLMEVMLSRADDPMQFHQRALLTEHSHENQLNNRQLDSLNEVSKMESQGNAKVEQDDNKDCKFQVKSLWTYHEGQDGSLNEGGTDLQDAEVEQDDSRDGQDGSLNEGGTDLQDAEVEQDDSRDCVSQANGRWICREEQDGLSTNGGGDAKDMLLYARRLSTFMVFGFLLYEIFS